MTESEYLACREYRPVLERHSKVRSTRKWRLFAIACCRLIWRLLPEESRQLLQVTERFLERQASDKDREAARRKDLDWQRDHISAFAVHYCAEPTSRIKTVARHDVPVKCVATASREEGKKARTACIARIADIVREVFGNPFQASGMDPTWATPLVLDIARGAYDERDPDSGNLEPARLAVLSDALEEAGCADLALLGHLRSPGPHVRGCWALDLVLGKE